MVITWRCGTFRTGDENTETIFIRKGLITLCIHVWFNQTVLTTIACRHIGKENLVQTFFEFSLTFVGKRCKSCRMCTINVNKLCV